MKKSGNIGKILLKILLGLAVTVLCVGVVAVGFILGTKNRVSTAVAAPDEAVASEGTEAEVASDTIVDDDAEAPDGAEPTEAAEAAEAAEATEEAAPAEGAEAADAAKVAEEAAPAEGAEATDAKASEAAETAPEGDAPAENLPAAEAGAAEAVETAPAEATAQGDVPAENTPVDQDPLLIAALNDPNFWDGCPARQVLLLTPNPYSRPQTAIKKVNSLVIHWVANPGSSAVENRDYFESLSDGNGRSASAHFIIGLDGEIVQCIPISEMAYACKDRNVDTLSIECCHPDADGKFNEATYYSLVDLAGWLCFRLDLKPEEILRHYDVTGKDCPKYYVDHEDSWQSLKNDIQARYDYLMDHQETDESEDSEE
ncbi:MAG: N-acetylmuramoyl-L-alanine amidase [Lachnospiraceae bacterium]|nr:N-acetylmuramoyl-L-alanine amidase [Lachnospiraceae bacterium]